MKYLHFLSSMAAAAVIAIAPLSHTDAAGYKHTNLVSDKNRAAMASAHDLSLVNPWGVAFFPGGPFWVSDNGTGVSTLYDGKGTKIPLTVKIPAPSGGACV
jgi:hypothetical protein